MASTGSDEAPRAATTGRRRRPYLVPGVDDLVAARRSRHHRVGRGQAVGPEGLERQGDADHHDPEQPQAQAGPLVS